MHVAHPLIQIWVYTHEPWPLGHPPPMVSSVNRPSVYKVYLHSAAEMSGILVLVIYHVWKMFFSDVP